MNNFLKNISNGFRTFRKLIAAPIKIALVFIMLIALFSCIIVDYALFINQVNLFTDLKNSVKGAWLEGKREIKNKKESHFIKHMANPVEINVEITRKRKAA